MLSLTGVMFVLFCLVLFDFYRFVFIEAAALRLIIFQCACVRRTVCVLLLFGSAMFVSLEISLFPIIFVPLPISREYVLRFPLPDGVFLPYHELDCLTSAYARIQSPNQ